MKEESYELNFPIADPEIERIVAKNRDLRLEKIMAFARERVMIAESTGNQNLADLWNEIIHLSEIKQNIREIHADKTLEQQELLVNSLRHQIAALQARLAQEYPAEVKLLRDLDVFLKESN